MHEICNWKHFRTHLSVFHNPPLRAHSLGTTVLQRPKHFLAMHVYILYLFEISRTW